MASDRFGRRKVAHPRRVLFDTSFLMAVMERPTPWLEDITDRVGSFEPLVIAPVYDELARLARRGDGASRFASLAKDLVDRGQLRLWQSVGNGLADDELISLALEDDAVVATLDKELIRQLKASGVKVLSLSRGRVSF